MAGAALAQKDAAEKAKEGDIGHWIEYYRAGQRNPLSDPQAPEGAAVRGKHSASAPAPAREAERQK